MEQFYQYPPNQQKQRLQKRSKKVVSKKDQIVDYYNWSVTLWNHLTNHRDYRDTGLGSSGQAIDIAFEYKQYQKEYAKMQKYTDWVNSLSETQYDDLKTSWASAVTEFANIDNNLATNGTAQGAGSIDTSILRQYLDVVWDDCNTLYSK